MNVLSEQDGWVFAAQYLNILFQNRMNILSEQDGWLFAVSENITIWLTALDLKRHVYNIP